METTAALRQALLADREQTLTGIYQRTFPMVRRYVQQHGGSAQDAKDVFHDALVIFYEKVVGETLVLSASASTYLVGVCRNLWRQELSRRTRQPAISLTDEHTEVAEEAELAEQATLSVLEQVERLGERCKDILLAFYYFQQPLEQIAATHQYRTVRSATVQKFKCLERLRNSVRALVSAATA
ncbi:sigma-70 family RNA polymerase sigma factor [Hymenobacter sp. HSC-4F20]|uniref:RNA polymerase sigma factor n=1 Tax=Hymenobacter sp. HSC-4F20 TaxID=2864135 RepID=UPI001C7335A2|nr:sigma-70 family RNA polymerase sigma factor [Hymenobacter sp. HSC-4F20]MBX0291665.1 sigma-70 family RNA polymerase sigma factor [Hymenobacter sp. HSC-4F20]